MEETLRGWLCDAITMAWAGDVPSVPPVAHQPLQLTCLLERVMQDHVLEFLVLESTQAHAVAVVLPSLLIIFVEVIAIGKIVSCTRHCDLTGCILHVDACWPWSSSAITRPPINHRCKCFLISDIVWLRPGHMQQCNSRTQRLH